MERTSNPIVALQESTGLSLRKLASDAGCPRPVLSRVKSGQLKTLSADVCLRLHATFPRSVSLEQLLSWGRDAEPRKRRTS